MIKTEYRYNFISFFLISVLSHIVDYFLSTEKVAGAPPQTTPAKTEFYRGRMDANLKGI
jgi:hypothetical protein